MRSRAKLLSVLCLEGQAQACTCNFSICFFKLATLIAVCRTHIASTCHCLQIERIVAERTDKNGERRYLCKFAGLPYGENTWELVSDVMEHGGKDQVDEYLRREQRVLQQPQSVEMARRVLFQRHRALEEQPAFLSGGQLRDYQLQSLNWMIYSWMRNVNLILADEMGLGKTVQVC